MGTDVHWYKNWISWAPCAWLWNLLMSRQKQPACMWSADKCLLLLIYHGCLYNYTVTNGHFGAGAIRHLFRLLQGKKQFKKLLWTIPARSPLQCSEIALQFVTTISTTFQFWKQPHAGAVDGNHSVVGWPRWTSGAHQGCSVTSPPQLDRKGRENRMKGSWVEIRTGEISFIYHQSNQSR